MYYEKDNIGLKLKECVESSKNFINQGKSLIGEPFALLIHVLNGYGTGGIDSTKLNNQFIDENGKTYCSMSLITNDFLGHVYQGDNDLVLGYGEITPDMYISSAPYDMYSYGENGESEISYQISPKYIDPLLTARRTIHRYNEFVLKRMDKDGKPLIPTCIVSFNDSVSNTQLEASKKYNLPILKIDANQYIEQQKQKIRDTYENLIIGEMNPGEGTVLNFLYSLTAYLYGFSWKNMNFPYEDDFLYFEKIPEIVRELLTKFKMAKNLTAIGEIYEFINDNPSKRNYTVFKEAQDSFNLDIMKTFEENRK